MEYLAHTGEMHAEENIAQTSVSTIIWVVILTLVVIAFGVVLSIWLSKDTQEATNTKVSKAGKTKKGK